MPFRILLLCVLIALNALAIREWLLQPDGHLHLHFFDVGQGDSALVITPRGQQIVVDGGPNLSPLEYLGRHMPFFDRTIELMILSHPDLDHVTALPEILKRYTVEAILFTGIEHKQGRYEALLQELTAQGTQVLLPDPKVDIEVEEGVVLDIIWPNQELLGQVVESPNDSSVVFRLLYGEHSILMPGDIEEAVEARIVASGHDIRSTVLKVPHHGSRTSSSTGFLLAVDPKLAIIPVGTDSPFGHPHQDVLDRYRALGIPTRHVGEEGGVSLRF